MGRVLGRERRALAAGLGAAAALVILPNIGFWLRNARALGSPVGSANEVVGPAAFLALGPRKAPALAVSQILRAAVLQMGQLRMVGVRGRVLVAATARVHRGLCISVDEPAISGPLPFSTAEWPPLNHEDMAPSTVTHPARRPRVPPHPPGPSGAVAQLGPPAPRRHALAGEPVWLRTLAPDGARSIFTTSRWEDYFRNRPALQAEVGDVMRAVSRRCGPGGVVRVVLDGEAWEYALWAGARRFAPGVRMRTGAPAPGEPVPCAIVRSRCPGTRAFCFDEPASP